jgi:hypothetical protein
VGWAQAGGWRWARCARARASGRHGTGAGMAESSAVVGSPAMGEGEEGGASQEEIGSNISITGR